MKTSITDLALFGGQPEFEDKLHVGAPNIGDRATLHRRLDDILDRRILTNRGPFVVELERQLSAYLGVKHVVAMCNGTVAMEIAIRALEMSGEVIVPAMTFVATAHAVQWQGIRPVFADIDPATYQIDAARIEEHITPLTTGIIGVHLWGRPCGIDALQDIATRHNLKLVFDAAHAMGTSHNRVMIGNFGNAEVFSFHATKVFNTFEGGAVTTNDDDLARKLRLMQNFGFSGKDNVIYIGTNGKMPEISAAMGITSLESLDHFIAVNRENYLIYRTAMGNIPGLRMLTYDASEKTNFQYIVFDVDEGATGISRDALVKVLVHENIIARRYFFPGVHEMEPYRSYQPYARVLLPETAKAVQRTLTLPNGTQLAPGSITRICDLIRFTLAHGRQVTALLRREGLST